MGRRGRRGGALARFRANAGIWSLVAVLAGAAVFVVSASGPVTTRLEDRAVRQMLEQAPAGVRDLTFHWPAFLLEQPPTAEEARQRARMVLPVPLRDDGPKWGIQRTGLLAVAGEGVSDQPDGWAPVVNIIHQTGLADEVTVVEGRAPASTGPDIEVVVAVAVAERLSLRVGQTYAFASGGFPTMRPADAAEARHRVMAAVVGLFEPRDPEGTAWQLHRELLVPFLTGVPAEPPEAALRAAVVTDQGGFTALRAHDSAVVLELETLARIRLDERQHDGAWAEPARRAVGELRTSPLVAGIAVRTGLDRLLEEFTRQAVASRSLVAVVVAGVVGAGAGLLLLAAALAAARRRGELSLLRARGASVPAVLGSLTAEASLLVVPAVVGGWLGYWLWLGWPDPVRPGELVAPALVALGAVLAVPVWAALACRTPRMSGERADLTRRRAAPGRLTLDLSVLLLAGLGVVLLQRRGLNLSGVDPYLSAVPVLIGAAAGLLAVRFYPWPLRLLGALVRRGTVGFLGLARAGRDAPAALPLVVLVVAVAVGAFGGAVQSGVAGARDAAALAEVGAHIRVAAGEDAGLDAAAVARVPGVTAVASSHRGNLRTGVPYGAAVRVVAVDTVAYQRVLADLGVSARLPEEMLSPPGEGPVPVLAGPHLADYGPLRFSFNDDERPVVVVGDVSALPGPGRGRDAVLVPLAAVPDPPPADELLITGADVDAAALRAAVGEEATVTTLAERRTALEESAFNYLFTLAFLTGTLVAGLAGPLVIALALVARAPVRGQALSRLRTMGLSMRQARGLLLLELLPLTVLAVGVGAAAGTAMPYLLGPALGLGEFTGGEPLHLGVDAAALGVLAGLVGILVLAGVVAEAAAHRRLGLGQVLRVE
jgi:putative ABC transport system permease protein